MMDYELTKEEKIALIKFNGGTKEDILSILLELQKASPRGYIDTETAGLVAEHLKMPYAEICQVISFYDMLETRIQARYVLKICNSTPCYFSRAEDVAAFLKQELGVGIGETTADGMFSYHYVPCVGACETGPVIVLKDAVYGNLTAAFLRQFIADLRSGKRTT